MDARTILRPFLFQNLYAIRSGRIEDDNDVLQAPKIVRAIPAFQAVNEAISRGSKFTGGLVSLLYVRMEEARRHLLSAHNLLSVKSGLPQMDRLFRPIHHEE